MEICQITLFWWVEEKAEDHYLWRKHTDFWVTLLAPLFEPDLPSNSHKLGELERADVMGIIVKQYLFSSTSEQAGGLDFPT